jgi:hypothetical protein
MANLGADMRAAIAGLFAGSTVGAFAGPYQLRFGAGWTRDGVTGEPAPGANGYARPSIAPASLVASVGLETTITINQAASVGPFSADLGIMRAVSLHDATGKCLAAGPITALVFNSGATRSIAAGAITITLA